MLQAAEVEVYLLDKIVGSICSVNTDGPCFGGHC